MNYRLYSFVANHYLSPLQCGLQTAHVVSELSTICADEPTAIKRTAFSHWAKNDKTIIICGAGNHKGVVDSYAALQNTAAHLGMPVALFREDEQSMNGMATACGVIVPEQYWNVEFVDETSHMDKNGHFVDVPGRWEHTTTSPSMVRYSVTSLEGQFISHLKSFRLA